MGRRERLASLGELVVVWVGWGLAIAATLVVGGVLSGRRPSRTMGCQILEPDSLTIQLVAVTAFVGATTMMLLYWALGAQRTGIRVARIIVALIVGAGLGFGGVALLAGLTIACSPNPLG